MSLLPSRRSEESSPCPRYPPAFRATIRPTPTVVILSVALEDPERLGTEDSDLVGKDLLFSNSLPAPTLFARFPQPSARLCARTNRRNPFPTMRLRTTSVTHPGGGHIFQTKGAVRPSLCLRLVSPLFTRHYPLSSLQSALSQNTPLTSLECAVSKQRT